MHHWNKVTNGSSTYKHLFRIVEHYLIPEPAFSLFSISTYLAFVCPLSLACVGQQHRSPFNQFMPVVRFSLWGGILHSHIMTRVQLLSARGASRMDWGWAIAVWVYWTEPGPGHCRAARLGLGQAIARQLDWTPGHCCRVGSGHSCACPACVPPCCAHPMQWIGLPHRLDQAYHPDLTCKDTWYHLLARKWYLEVWVWELAYRQSRYALDMH